MAKPDLKKVLTDPNNESFYAQEGTSALTTPFVATSGTGGTTTHGGLSDMPDTGGINSDHDARYYTQAQIDSNISTHASNADIHHSEAHTIASHSDTTASGSELDTLTNGSNADSLHSHALAEVVTHADLSDMPDTGGTITDHDNRYYTQAQVDSVSGTLSAEIDSDISTHSASAAHDSRYYTESEVDSEISTLSSTLSSEIDSDISTHNLSISTHIRTRPVNDDGLLCHYPFNDDAKDFSGNGYHGTVYGATLVSDGRLGGAYTFNGTSDYIDLGNNFNFDASDSFTVAFWFKTPSITAVNTGLVDKRGLGALGTSQGWTIYILNRKIVLITDDGADGVTSTTTNDTIASGTYLFATAVVDRSSNYQSLYINGALADSDDITAVNDLTTTKTIKVGARHGSPPASFFEGTIDDLRIYNRALPSDEIRALYSLCAEFYAGKAFAKVSGDTIGTVIIDNDVTILEGNSLVLDGDGGDDYITADSGGIIVTTNNFVVSGTLDTTGYKVGAVAGATGSFTTADAKTVTVVSGIITSIV